jgi:cbb3-type cytochrome oxidase maturation protein
MSVIALLIAAGGLVAGGFLLAFVWAVRTGQFDDMTTPGVRVLLDDASRDRAPAQHVPLTIRHKEVHDADIP